MKEEKAYTYKGEWESGKCYYSGDIFSYKHNYYEVISYHCYFTPPNPINSNPHYKILRIDTLGAFIPIHEPPLGLRPRFIWIELRIAEIKRAIDRYKSDNYEIPIEWVNEYNELIKEIK